MILILQIMRSILLEQEEEVHLQEEEEELSPKQ
jgi:hypothetical protein